MEAILLPFAAIVAAIGGGLGIYSAALALGVRHGIDWDHIAAITDITSATASTSEEKESWLLGEPGLMITDESHHLEHSEHDHSESRTVERREPVLVGVGAGAGATAIAGGNAPVRGWTRPSVLEPKQHAAPFWLGTLYALGHGLVVTVLGVIAILASEVLPDWIDPLMERVVGVTLILLAVYLFYSVYQYFRRGDTFRIRSRWMLVFAGVASAWHWIRSRFGEHEHSHVLPRDYSSKTAFAIGMVHGIGAETGTQALILATAVGATSKSVAILSLLCFVVGLLISNSFVTLTTTVGFISAGRRQLIYVCAGIVAAVFSLVVGVLFLAMSTDLLPGLDRYTRWIGGPS